MPWIMLLLALACFTVPFLTTSFGLGALCLLLALVFLLLGMMGLISSRLQDNRRPEQQMLTPQELHTLRERAEAQHQAAATSEESAQPPEQPTH